MESNPIEALIQEPRAHRFEAGDSFSERMHAEYDELADGFVSLKGT
jgi:hypothetical protein